MTSAGVLAVSDERKAETELRMMKDLLNPFVPLPFRDIDDTNAVMLLKNILEAQDSTRREAVSQNDAEPRTGATK